MRRVPLSASPPAIWASAATAIRKDRFSRGMELRGKYVLIAEGARGSLAKELIAKFALAADCEPQKFGIGLKELWSIAPEKHQPGRIATFLRLAARRVDRRRLFLYHFEDGLVSRRFCGSPEL